MMYLNEYVIKGFKKMFADHGYEWFDGDQSYNLNIFSIRDREPRSGKFDDFLYVVFRNKRLQWEIRQYSVTTDPGTFYLENPANIKGTAILKQGQYKGVYKLDLHNGKYLALCQRLGKVKVYRDDNRDEILDHDPNTVDEGFFGINIHKAKENTENVGNWSAGCTVFKNSSDFNEFIYICKKSKKKFGNKFTYTLFDDGEEN